MLKRRLLTVSALLVLPLIGVGVYLLIPPNPGVTLENFRRLHEGMSREEVESILGSKGTLKGIDASVATYSWNGIGGSAWIDVRLSANSDSWEVTDIGIFLSATGEREDLKKPIGVADL